MEICALLFLMGEGPGYNTLVKYPLHIDISPTLCYVIHIAFFI